MKLLYASEYRSAARGMLRGKWTEAVLVGLVSSLICGQVGFRGTSAFRINLNLDDFAYYAAQYPEDTGFVDSIAHLLFSGRGGIAFADRRDLSDRVDCTGRRHRNRLRQI